MSRSLAGVALSFFVALAACSDGTSRDAGSTLRQAKLVPLSSCNDVEAAARQRALQAMNARLDQNLKAALAGGQTCPERGGPGGLPIPVSAPTAPPTASPANSAAGGSSDKATSVSGTNNQVVGVDEADFVKNDGKHIYIVEGSSFRIVEAWPVATARTIGKVTVPGIARKLYVTDTRALVYSSLDASAAPASDVATGSGVPVSPTSRGGGGTSECTYGYDCEFIGDGRPTQITVFDITNRAAPVVVRELRTGSSYVNARRVGNAVFTVLASQKELFPALAEWPTDVRGCGQQISPAQIQASFDQLREKNRQIIEATDVTALLPVVRDTLRLPDGSSQTRDNALADCRHYFSENVSSGNAFTTVLALDLGSNQHLETATVYSRPGAVYASATALYFSVPQQQDPRYGWYESYADVKQLSTVHKFDLGTAAPVGVSYSGSGIVKGRVLNQFAMDEHERHLRIATTTGRVPDPEVHSTMSVLGAGDEGGLVVVGQVDRLAPKEDIRSVRFDGARGYVVTFKKTDPLFVFDLSNPREPRVEAELKIPGFSTYMHRMDANHLLTIGYDAADQGNFAYFTGVLLQVFDVTDPKNPFLKHKTVIGTRGSSSEALTNHLAFNYFAPRDLLLLPMTICEAPASGSGIFGGQPTFSGLLAYKVTTATGFEEGGRVPHPAQAGITCGNWWTNASSQVRRSIVMDDYVFSISGSQIKANKLGMLAADVATISLTD